MRPYTIVLRLPLLIGMFCLCTKTVQPTVEHFFACSNCTSEDTVWGSAVNVQCGERNLTRVPNTTFDKPVSLLNVSFNVLKTLKEDALFSYESVRYLYLQHCKIVNINETAFQRLENLTVIDLSSNRLISISPHLFNGNQKLEQLILRNNELRALQWNIPILNGPSSLYFLDLQSCQLSNISAMTFSSLLNLEFLDISRNNLVLLHNDTLSSHQKLKDVNLENNPWECGTVFKALLCWMHNKLPLSQNRTLKCQYSRNETWDILHPTNQSLFCNSDSSPSVTSSHTTSISTSTKQNPASTLSHELDNPKNTTLNNEVQIIEEPVTSSKSWYLWVILGVCFVLAVLLLCCFYVYRRRKTQCRVPEGNRSFSVVYKPVSEERV